MDQLEIMISLAEKKFWVVWIRDQQQCAAVMYKPSGASAAWVDDGRQGTHKELCCSIAVGDMVDTDFSRKITRHRVTDRRTGAFTQTGCQLRVTPPVPGSSYISEPGDRAQQRKAAWIDAAWFRPARALGGAA